MTYNDYYVYIHRRNDTNEVFYVGKGRGRRATSKTGRNVWWVRIENKYGRVVEYVEKGLSEYDAFILEIEIIKFYRDCGHILCNMTDGGEGSSGSVHSDETKQKLSQIMLERYKSPWWTPERRLLQSERAKGRIVSEETRRKISLFRKGRKHTELSKQKMLQSKCNQTVAVMCSNGMYFNSLGDAVRWLVVNGWPLASTSAISRACRGKVKQAYGYGWTYTNGLKNVPKAPIVQDCYEDDGCPF